MAISASAVDLLITDHRDIEKLFTQLDHALESTSLARADKLHYLVRKVTRALVTHSVAEEIVIYPRIAAKLDKVLADTLLAEQSEAERVLKVLEGMSPTSSGYASEIAQLIGEVRKHMREEEATAFPQLTDLFSPRELAVMGQELTDIKRIGPTRPHPLAPSTPPLNLLIGPPTGLLDRARDLVSGRR